MRNRKITQLSFIILIFTVNTPLFVKAQEAIINLHLNALPGQIIHDPNNPTKMVYNRDSNNDGLLDPFFLSGSGDPEGFLFRGNRNNDGTRSGDQMKLIRKLKKYGGNSIYLMAVRTHGGDAWKDKRDDPKTYPDDLHNPWIDQDPKKGLNEKILDQWEEWFTEMDKHGIVIYFFFYDDAINVGKNLGWPLDEKENLHPDEKEFVQALVKRFKHHKHLIWCVMEEGQEIGDKWRQHVSKIAEAISEADDHNHIIASHQLGGNIFFHKNDPKITQFALQTNQDYVRTTDELYHWMVEARKNSEGIYSIVMSEDYYHGNYSIPNNDREGYRQRCWAAAMADAYIMVFGMDIENTPKSWLRDLKVIQNFFENSNFNQMYPVSSLAFGETSYVLANEGFDYILYSFNAENNLGVKHVNTGKYSFTWLDCVSGKTKIIKSVDITQGNHSWIKPRGFGSEVALYIQREDKRPQIEKIQVIRKQVYSESQIANVAPVAESAEVQVNRNTQTTIQLRYVDADGAPGPYTIEIVSGPKNGILSGVGNDRFYTPNKDYIGEDRFTWKVNDGEDDSNIAVITIKLH